MDAMDLDPPEPQRPLMQPQPQPQLQQQLQQHTQHQPLTSQSSCPGVRLDPYAHSHNSTAGRYDPVHGAADNAWGSHQWQPGPPATGGYYMHQRSQSGSDTFTSSFPGSTLGQQPQPPPIAPPEPYAYQLPFGYQTTMANQAIAGGPQPSHGATQDPYFGPVPYGMPMLHSGGAATRLAPIHPAFRSMERMSMSLGPMHGQPFGGTPQQSPFYGSSHTNNLRPQPPAQQRSSRSSSHSTSSANPSATWLQTHRANAAAPPPPPPSSLLSAAANSSSNNPQQQQQRTSHSSSRRYRPASYRPTSSMVSSGDMSTSPTRSARGGPGSPFLERDDDSVRDAQFARGAMITTSVASLSAIKSLQKLEISSLPEGERTCNICYTDFGVKTPEGITELPVKIPVCQHVFGSNCIRTWFKDADHCPYCRAKVQSEHKHTFPPGSAHASAVLSQQLSLMMRSRAGHAMTHNPTLVSELLQQGILPEHLATPPPFHDRRPPPTNSEDAHRRQRARHGSYNTSQMRSQPSSLRQEQSMHQMQYHLAGEQSRTQTPPSGAQPANHDDSVAGDAAPNQQPAPGSPVTDRPDSQRLPRNSGVPQLSAMMSQHDLPSWQPPWIPTTLGTGPGAANALGGNTPAPRLAPGVSP